MCIRDRFEAARRGVGIISVHTNLDRSCAARTLLPRLMGLTASTSLEWAEEPERTGIGGICETDPITVKELALRAQEAFATCAQAWGRPDALVRRIAFVGGSLGDFGELALEHGCDAVVTGELGYHRAQDLAPVSYTHLDVYKRQHTHHIEDASELEASWFAGVEHIGVTAGASTPAAHIDRAVEKIRALTEAR